MALSQELVTQQLEAASRRWRMSSGARFLVTSGAAVLGQILVYLQIDRWFHLGAMGRWTAFGCICATVLAGLVMAWRAWAEPITLESMARRIEVASGDRSNVLISAVQLGKELPAGSPLRSALFREMQDPFPRVSWEQVFEWGRLRKLAYILIGIGVVLCAIALSQPKGFANSFLRILLPASNIQPLTRTIIESVTPGDETVPHGRDVSVRVALGGEIPRSAWVRYREEGGEWQRVLMDHEAGQPEFTFTWREVKHPMEYRVEAGDARSILHRIEVRPQTVVKQRVVEIVPPAYTGLPPAVHTEQGLISGVLPGSLLRFKLTFNNPVSELSAWREKGEKVEKAGEQAADKEKSEALEAIKVSEMEWTFEETVKGAQTLRLEFRDKMGVTERAAFPLMVQADTPPKVTIAEPLEGQELFGQKGDRLAIRFSVSDNLGLGSVALYQSSEEKEDAKLLQQWDEVKGKAQFEGAAVVTVQPLATEGRVTFCVVAKDLNDVTGPGSTISRPVVVHLRTAEKVVEEKKATVDQFEKGLEALMNLQSRNLDETRVALKTKATGSLEELVTRQTEIQKRIGEMASAASAVGPDVRDLLAGLQAREAKEAVIRLRDASGAEGQTRQEALIEAAKVEAVILAKLKGAPAAAEEEEKRAEVAKVIGGIEELMKQQVELLKKTKVAGKTGAAVLSAPQDALAERVVVVKKGLEIDAKNQAIGDEDFRKRLEKVIQMIGELKTYEGMLTAAELLQSTDAEGAQKEQLQVIQGLSKMLAVLNEWRQKDAQEKKEEFRQKLDEMSEKLKNLTDTQKDIVEKTKELARKSEFRPDDIAQMDELKKTKDQMKEAIEQMTTDLQAFPDTKAGNEMKDAMMQILEDVEQQDLEDALEGKLKATEIAVQKEQGLLDALKKAKELSGDMEHWLSSKLDTTAFKMENFDKTEMPEIPMLPLSDAFEDLVGELLKEQKGLAEDALSAASNQALAEVPPGWDVADGVMPAFGAQGKSGNTAPKHNEQMGRSSGGREGMSDGEMAGTETQMLKGDTPDARRTRDAMQQGQVKDNGEVGQVRATGGGKAGGFSDRTGMEGNGPVRAVESAKKPADVLAIEQAVLAEKAATKVAEAKLLSLKSDGLKDVQKLMVQAQQALAEGRGKDASGLHQRIIQRLSELKNGVTGSQVISRATADSARAEERRTMGATEGEAPSAYKGLVSEYFRSLSEEKGEKGR